MIGSNPPKYVAKVSNVPVTFLQRILKIVRFIKDET